MSVLSDDQIRLAILDVLHKSAKEHPVTSGIMKRDEFQQVLKIPENYFEFNLWYLEQKKLIERTGFYGDPFWTATVTALGVDVVEHRELFLDKLPFTQATITIQGNVYGNVIQAINSQVDFNQQITDTFKQAYDQVDAKVGITPDEKAAIKKNLTELETDLKTKDKDAGKIQTTWNTIKRNAGWIVPTLAQVVLDGIKIALGIH